MVNKIFIQLQAIYPAWKQAYSTDQEAGETKKQWIKGLIESSISDYSVIQAGIAACRDAGSPFIPTVGQFIGYCNKAICERMGALDTMSAYNHLLGYYARPAQSRDVCELNPIVFHMISDPGFDVFAFKNMERDKPVKYFSDHYQATLKYLAAGGEIKKPIDSSKRIDNPSGTVHRGRSSKETASREIAAIRQLLKK